MKILVTGSHGRVGGNLVKRLLDQGHDIRGFVYPGDASRAGKWADVDEVEIVEGDLRDFEAVSRAVEGVDAVYHLAAAFASPHSNIEYLQINGLGTLHLLEAVREKVPQLQRFVYACTEAIYWKGRGIGPPVREADFRGYGQRDPCDAVFFDQVDRRRIGDELRRAIRPAVRGLSVCDHF